MSHIERERESANKEDRSERDAKKAKFRVEERDKGANREYVCAHARVYIYIRMCEAKETERAFRLGPLWHQGASARDNAAAIGRRSRQNR